MSVLSWPCVSPHKGTGKRPSWEAHEVEGKLQTRQGST